MPADAGALADALTRIGIACDVEREGALAILVPRESADVPTAEARRAIVRAARDAGFASVAFELRGPSGPVDPTAS